MKAFMGPDFLLNNDTALNLYNKYADMRKIPVIDYHCHINPQEIYEDRVYDNITQVWLGGDHYKWRQMRINGIEEKYITGDASDWEKFQKWAEIMPKLIGNPLYHWSHLELRYYFGYMGNLNADTAKEVWNLCNEKLRSNGFSVRGIIKQSNVKLICTTDDPVDDLMWHKLIKEDTTFDIKVLPAWRPDNIINIASPNWKAYITKLSVVSETEINDWDSLKTAIIKRMDYFEENGCLVSDHGLDYVTYYPSNDVEIDSIVKRALMGDDISQIDYERFKTAFMIFVSQQYNDRDWVMQLHYGVKRENNSPMVNSVGYNAGFDCVDGYAPSGLTDLFNKLAEMDLVPKSIIYSINPNDDALINTMVGCFQKSGTKNRVQQGSAWWFNDNMTGMINQLRSYANLSSLGNFVGMLTDSRSFLSYTRHDYFRRILCNLIGEWVENGEFPFEEKILSEIIKGISYNNAVSYFGFDLEKI